jgi:hypothetical protein
MIARGGCAAAELGQRDSSFSEPITDVVGPVHGHPPAKGRPEARPSRRTRMGTRTADCSSEPDSTPDVQAVAHLLRHLA